MRVKKFEAKSMKEALQMVKNELGPDAVILGARDNRRAYGLGGESSVEITAAVSESTLQKKKFVESRMNASARERFMQSDAKTQRKIIEHMVDARIQARASTTPVGGEARVKRAITPVSYIDIQDEVPDVGPRRNAALERAKGKNVRELLDGFEQDFSEAEDWQQSTTREVATQAPQPTEKAIQRIRSAAKEAWQAGLFSDDEARAKATPAAVKQKTPAAAAAPVPQKAQARPTTAPSAPRESEIISLKNEIGRLQQMLEGMQKTQAPFVAMHPGAEYGIPYDLSFMFQKLTESGITIDHTIEILQQAAKEIDPVQMKKRPIVDAWVARWFLNATHTVATPWQGRLHLFVGGAGSGKTSTLVKMASHLVVREKKKVAILSTDSFKVGAVDQLKIYCQILNVPFAVLRNRKDWDWVLGQLPHIDHILVDFPGLQLRDLDEIHLLKSLLPPPELAPVCHFCVSATSKDGDAYEIARRYRVADYGDLIFTNLDQSVQHGIIYNLQKKTGKPLHSFGIGSRIPEDFEAASKERVLDLIFKLTKLRRESK